MGLLTRWRANAPWGLSGRWLALLAAPLMLTSCLLEPTKFVSTLDIAPDRTFTFSYVGEVRLMESKPDLPVPDGTDDSDDGTAEPDNTEARYIAIAAGSSTGETVNSAARTDSAEDAAKLEQLAEALRAEYGYRAARYIGNRTLAIDYRISGTLDHAFTFPFNPDGEVIMPFLAIELRGKDRVRVKAPAFANDDSKANPASGMMGGNEKPSLLDGTFTLTTAAEIVSQNQEDGAERLADGRRRVSWKINPNTRDAPMAVLRVKPLP